MPLFHFCSNSNKKKKRRRNEWKKNFYSHFYLFFFIIIFLFAVQNKSDNFIYLLLCKWFCLHICGNDKRHIQTIFVALFTEFLFCSELTALILFIMFLCTQNNRESSLIFIVMFAFTGKLVPSFCVFNIYLHLLFFLVLFLWSKNIYLFLLFWCWSGWSVFPNTNSVFREGPSFLLCISSFYFNDLLSNFVNWKNWDTKKKKIV